MLQGLVDKGSLRWTRKAGASKEVTSGSLSGEAGSHG